MPYSLDAMADEGLLTRMGAMHPVEWHNPGIHGSMARRPSLFSLGNEICWTASVLSSSQIITIIVLTPDVHSHVMCLALAMLDVLQLLAFAEIAPHTCAYSQTILIWPQTPQSTAGSFPETTRTELQFTLQPGLGHPLLRIASHSLPGQSCRWFIMLEHAGMSLPGSCYAGAGLHQGHQLHGQ